MPQDFAPVPEDVDFILRVGLFGMLVPGGHRTRFRGLTRFFLRTCLLIHESAHFGCSRSFAVKIHFRASRRLAPTCVLRTLRMMRLQLRFFFQEGVWGNLTFDKKWGSPKSLIPPLPSPPAALQKIAQQIEAFGGEDRLGVELDPDTPPGPYGATP